MALSQSTDFFSLTLLNLLWHYSYFPSDTLGALEVQCFQNTCTRERKKSHILIYYGHWLPFVIRDSCCKLFLATICDDEPHFKDLPDCLGVFYIPPQTDTKPSLPWVSWLIKSIVRGSFVCSVECVFKFTGYSSHPYCDIRS